MAGGTSHRLAAGLLLLAVLFISGAVASQEIIIGSGTSIQDLPLTTSCHDARTQTIYLASEIGDAYRITALALYVTTIPGQPMNSFTIRMKHTDLSAYVSQFWESDGWTVVYQTTQTITTTGWVQFGFSTPFEYNGTEGLMVDISFNNTSGSTDGYCRYSQPDVIRTAWLAGSDYGDPLGWSGRVPCPIMYDYVPNVRLTVEPPAKVALPVFSPSAGTFNSEQNVTITCLTPDAAIHYTTNGLDPNETDPVIPPGNTVIVDHSLTLKARAWKDGMQPGDVRAAAYQLVVASPVFDPAGGIFLSDVGVAITCTTADADIHYTTNGLEPTRNDPVVEYGQDVLISTDLRTTLRAKAFRDGWTPSDVSTAVYYVPAVIYVCHDGNDAADGLSWLTAKQNLQAALEIAQPDDEIWVAAGTYKPTSDYGLVAGSGEVQARLKHFRMKDRVRIYGGFAGTESDRDQRDWKANVTILSGDLNGNGLDPNDAYHIFYHPSSTSLDPNAVLDGFTITGGNATGPIDYNYADSGAGIYNYRCSPTIANCVFTANSASSAAGIYNSWGSSPVITDCVFIGNQTFPDLDGSAAIFVRGSTLNPSAPVISGCKFTANNAVGTRAAGAAIMCSGSSATLSLTSCTFTNNTVSGPYFYHNGGNGGAILVEYGAALKATDCVFTGNAATLSGGAIYVYSATAVITGCRFEGNSASTARGGGVYVYSGSATIADSTFIRNTAPFAGGIRADSTATLSVSGCIFIGNSTTYVGGGGITSLASDTNITNCVFLGNVGRQGGGLWNGGPRLRMVNSVFVGNNALYTGTDGVSSYGAGGGISSGGSDARIVNTVLWNNGVYGSSALEGGTATVLANCIVWDDRILPATPVAGSAVVTYSNIPGGWTGQGNTDADPLFIRQPSPGPDYAWGTDDDDLGDLRLRPGSPCIDAGDNSAVPAGVTTDLAGNPRFADDPDVNDIGAGAPPIVDIGVYEGMFAKVERPMLSPSGGEYLEDVNVIVTCPTPGAAIHYTTDGTEPTEDDPLVAGGTAVPVAVTPATVLKARAFCPGSAPSDIARGVYYRPIVIHVSTTGNDANDGLSWDSAKRTLQAGLDAAGPYHEIWIAQGTYYPTVAYGGTTARYKAFQLKNDVGVYGGFAGTETTRQQRNWKANLTILSGDLDQSDTLSAGDAQSVFYLPASLRLGRTAVLDGVTISGGLHGRLFQNLNPPPISLSYYGGAGISCSWCTPTLANCTFAGNNCFFESSKVMFYYGYGAAIYAIGEAPLVLGCSFVSNSANIGGGIYSQEGCLTVEDSVFTANSSAAVYAQRSLVNLKNSMIAQDGAVAFYGSACTLNVADCSIVANSGRAIYLQGGSSACVNNSILWANYPAGTDQVYFSSDSTLTISHSAVQGGFPGAENIDSNPLFVRDPNAGPDGTFGTTDDITGDLRLLAGSPCIDAGSNALVPAGMTKDIAGKRRVVDGTGDGNDVVDMGAYERQCVANPPGDASYDCGIDFADYSMVTAQWLQPGCSPANYWCSRADVDQNGQVDIFDIATLADGWLTDTRDIPDFAPSRTIDSADLVLLLSNWLRTDCDDTNQWCDGTDMNSSAAVDLTDLALFATHWLEGI